jgi:hypothetical protein
MGSPLRQVEGSGYYWSLPLYWGVTRVDTHSLTGPLSLAHDGDQWQVAVNVLSCLKRSEGAVL